MVTICYLWHYVFGVFLVVIGFRICLVNWCTILGLSWSCVRETVDPSVRIAWVLWLFSYRSFR